MLIKVHTYVEYQPVEYYLLVLLTPTSGFGERLLKLMGSNIFSHNHPTQNSRSSNEKSSMTSNFKMLSPSLE